MATSINYFNYILEQLSSIEEVTYRSMMGEYILYYKGKIVGGVYDNRLLVKDVPSAVKLIKNVKYEMPYIGAKPMILIEETDNSLFLKDLLEKLESKEKRIKEAYMNEIDTLEEYKENKLLLAKERADLEEKIKNTSSEQIDNTEKIKNDMQERIKNVCDIITSDNFTSQQKNDAMKSIVEKIVYKKDEKTVEIYYYYI